MVGVRVCVQSKVQTGRVQKVRWSRAKVEQRKQQPSREGVGA